MGKMKKQLAFVIGVVMLLVCQGCATDPRFGELKKTIPIDVDRAMDLVISILQDAEASPMIKGQTAKEYNKFADKFFELHKNKMDDSLQAQEWDQAIAHADRINYAAMVVKDNPTSVPITVSPPDPGPVREAAAREAAALHYSAGLDLQSTAVTKDEFKAAAKEFKRVFELVPGYEDAEQRYRDCQERAMQKVAILYFGEPPQNAQLGIGEFLADEFMVACTNSSDRQEYVSFLNADQLRILAEGQGITLPATEDPTEATRVGKALGIDALVIGRVSSVSVNYPADEESRVSRSGVITKTVRNADGSYYNVEVPVSATVYYFKRHGEANVTASFQLLSVEGGEMLCHGEKQAKPFQAYSWARFSGNEAALTLQDRNACKMPEGRPKPQMENIALAIKEIADHFASEVCTYFNK